MQLLILLLALFATVAACGFGGLGGGGCGGGCGCGGRKKRSVESVPLPFTNLAARDADSLCNSPELRETMLQTMKGTAAESGKAISAQLERFGDRYVVVCAQKRFDYFVRHDTEFCGIRRGDFYCQAFAI